MRPSRPHIQNQLIQSSHSHVRSMLILSSSRIVAEISSMDLEVEERYLMPSRSIIRWASSTSYSQFSIEAYLELGRRSPRISERRLGEMDRPKILSLRFPEQGQLASFEIFRDNAVVSCFEHRTAWLSTSWSESYRCARHLPAPRLPLPSLCWFVRRRVRACS